LPYPFRPRSRREVIDYCFFWALLLLAKPTWFSDFILPEKGLAAQWSSEVMANFFRIWRWDWQKIV